MSLLIEILGEFLLQMLIEALAEVGLHALKEPFKRPPNPWFASIGYALFGCVAGGISLWLVPDHCIPEGPWRVVNVAVTPMVVGLAMALIGAWRSKRNLQVIKLDRFSYGALFALALGLMRFFLAR